VFFDNHLHLRRDGFYLEAVKDFIKAGGTHFVLCQNPMPELVMKEKSYSGCYEKTLKMAEEIRSQLDVGVFVTVGPYPVDFLRLEERFGWEKTVEIMKKGMDEAAQFCEDKKGIAIGEIGRPHFPVDEKIIDVSNEILFYGMEKAADVGVPVVLHTESTTSDQCKKLVKMGNKAGLSAEKIVKHFSPALIKKEENFGLIPSVLSSRKNVVESLKKGSRFLMETDYIDDPKRPGAVLGPKTIPRLTKKLLDEKLMTDAQAYEIHVRNPIKTYGIDLED
jgi:TatD-related deoxyribonuclease